MTLEGHKEKIVCAEFDSRGRNICSIAADNQIRIWRVMDGRCTKTLNTKVDSQITCCTTSTTGQGQKPVLICGCLDGTIIIYDLERKTKMLILKGHSKEIRQLKLHPIKKELLCSSSGDGTLRLWDLVRGDCSQVVDGEFGVLPAFTFIPNTGHLLLACCQASAPPAKESQLQKITRSTFMFLASGSGSAKLQGAGWNEGSTKLVLVGFDGTAFTSMMATAPLHSVKNERVTSATFTESAESICSVTSKKVHVWDIKFKAIVPSMREPGDGEIAINIFEPEREARPSELMEEIEPDELEQGPTHGAGVDGAPASSNNGFRRAPAHDMSSYPPNYHAERGRREEAVEQRLLESPGNGGGGGPPRAPRAPAGINEIEEVEGDSDDEANPRVTAAVGWSLKPMEPASNTSQYGGFGQGGVVAVPIADDDPGAPGAGVGSAPRGKKSWRGRGGGAPNHDHDVSPDYS